MNAKDLKNVKESPKLGCTLLIYIAYFTIF